MGTAKVGGTCSLQACTRRHHNTWQQVVMASARHVQ